MPERKGLLNRLRILALAAGLAVLAYLIISRLSSLGYVLVALIGIGTIILIHELGHFTVAKLMGIKIEAFSIGFPPLLAAVMRTERGCRVRILPGFFKTQKDDNCDDGSLAAFHIGRQGRPGETEYRIGLIPFGGYVKMLGQEDIGQTKQTDDPRSYANKPVGIRAAVIAAGVLFNAISAILVLMLIFLVGIYREPPVVGGTKPDSPAARAGLRPGDEIVEIEGKSKDLEFIDLVMAAALSAKDDRVPLKVRHSDGSLEEYQLLAEQTQGPAGSLKLFGISSADSLTVAGVCGQDAEKFFTSTGLKGGDQIIAVNGTDVQHFWDMERIVRNALLPQATLLVKRYHPDSQQAELVDAVIRLSCLPTVRKSESELEPAHVYSMIPRLRVGKGLLPDKKAPPLQDGDVILSIGDVENPTYNQMRQVTEQYKDKELSVRVLRAGADNQEQVITTSVVPHRSTDSNEVLIGIAVELDFDRPVVAETISAPSGPQRLQIPSGATIVAVDGEPVSSFYDVVERIRQSTSERITLDYRLSDEVAGFVVLDLGKGDKSINVESYLAEPVPFKPLLRLYKAAGPIDAARMGFAKTVKFGINAYLTLRRFFTGHIDPKNFMGPVGIVAVSYKIVSESQTADYFYLMALISVFIAVINCMPLLPFDGGHIVFLAIEKIKGSPVSERVQTVAAYIGLAIIVPFAVYLTYNDIGRLWDWFLKGIFS